MLASAVRDGEFIVIGKGIIPLNVIFDLGGVVFRWDPDEIIAGVFEDVEIRQRVKSDIFDGKVISCRINMVKPEPGIYQHLLNKYNLRANETVFIDDTFINLEAALGLGITPVKFENPHQCRRDLKKIGCI